MSAPFVYEYPRPKNCDHVILTVKIYSLFNLKPTSPDWYYGISDSEERVCIHSSRELTPDEKRKLDALMADPGYPQEAEGTVFVVEDLFDAWEEMEKKVGARIRWIFPNVPDHTKLEVWFDRPLSLSEKKRFISSYSQLASEKA